MNILILPLQYIRGGRGIQNSTHQIPFVFHTYTHQISLVVPDRVHTEAGLRYPDPGYTTEELVLPPIYLDPALLVVRDSQPLVAPIAGRNGVAVAPAGRRRVEADLRLDGAAIPQPEGRDVTLQIEAVGPARGEEVPPGLRQAADIATVHGVVPRDPRRNERVRVVRVDRHVGCRIDDVLAETVARLHEGVQVFPRRVHGDPARVVARVRGVDAADELEAAGPGLRCRLSPLGLPVHPQLIRPQVRRVEVRLGRIEHHAVDARVGLVGVVLGVLGERTGRRHGEDGAVARVIVEGVAVDGVRRLLGR